LLGEMTRWSSPPMPIPPSDSDHGVVTTAVKCTIRPLYAELLARAELDPMDGDIRRGC
jgi:hypothetical protein